MHFQICIWFLYVLPESCNAILYHFQFEIIFIIHSSGYGTLLYLILSTCYAFYNVIQLYVHPDYYPKHYIYYSRLGYSNLYTDPFIRTANSCNPKNIFTSAFILYSCYTLFSLLDKDTVILT